MSLENAVNEALKQAMLAKDEVRKRAVRAIKAQILLIKTDASGGEITDDKITTALFKMLKQREESRDIYLQNGREDLAKVESEDIAVIKEFLPKQLTAEELEAIIKEVIAEVGATSAKDMGKVMGAASKKIGTGADGKAISTVVKRLLA